MEIYYTIQNVNAWNEALQRGYLVGNEEFIWQNFIRPYQWMMSQMSKRIPDYQEEFPVWLWKEKPDINQSGYMEKGERAVLIEVELPETKVLLSDFYSWHNVLWNLPILDNESEMICKELSWERIFDLEYLLRHPDWGMVDIQVVTGKIDIHQVKSVKEFTCK